MPVSFTTAGLIGYVFHYVVC